jgi:hypothetical protein
MRVTHAVVAALAVAVAAGLAGPTALVAGSAGAATSRATTVAVSPSPGDRFASPQTTISFRGVTPAALGSVRVTGSRSGVHPGRLVADPEGVTIWKPRAPFVPGERVTVRTGVAIAGARGHSFYFAVARIAPYAPEVLPPESGTGTRATISASATPPGPASSSPTPQVAATCKPGLPSFRSEPGLFPPGFVSIRPRPGPLPGSCSSRPGAPGTGATGPPS